MGFKDAAKPHYFGHRERLRKRFRDAGPDALPDYELIELVLFRAMPRRDTKPLAKALLARFGTFAEAVNAPEELLREIPGIGEAAITEIKLVRAAALRLMRGEVLDRPVLASWAQVLDYCRASMGFEAKEQFRILWRTLNLSLSFYSLRFTSPTRPLRVLHGLFPRPPQIRPRIRTFGITGTLTAETAVKESSMKLAAIGAILIFALVSAAPASVNAGDSKWRPHWQGHGYHQSHERLRDRRPRAKLGDRQRRYFGAQRDRYFGVGPGSYECVGYDCIW